MHLSLTLHPDSGRAAATGIDVDVTRPGPGNLLLRYVVTGGIADLRLPPVTAPAPARTDELWLHTCFEAFLRPSPGAAYYEFNFAPSMRWAAYRFDNYRSEMRVADGISAPRIETRSDDGSYEFRASLSLDGLPDPLGDSAWRLGLSAVIEEADGGISHWALAHPPGKADFHHSDCFALDLPAAWPP